MRNAQKILRRDPDLMTVMQINISDEEINKAPENNKMIGDNKKKEFGNLFG